jgi:hypothetical protein
MFTYLATEGAGVPCVLRDFHLKIAGQRTGRSEGKQTHLFHLLTQRCTITLQETGQKADPSIKWDIILTVPYFPVTPTLRVRFVCNTIVVSSVVGVEALTILL